MPHIHEKIDFCAEVYVVHNNKVLLRKHDKLGIWLSVGGHIELDEDPNQGPRQDPNQDPKLTLSEKEQTDGVHWFTLEELETTKDIKPGIRHKAKTALETLSS